MKWAIAFSSRVFEETHSSRGADGNFHCPRDLSIKDGYQAHQHVVEFEHGTSLIVF
jgi:hypothetical protein